MQRICSVDIAINSLLHDISKFRRFILKKLGNEEINTTLAIVAKFSAVRCQCPQSS